MLDDRSARVEATAYSEVYQQCRDLLVKDQIVIVEGRVAQDDRTGAPVMRVSSVRSLSDERAQHASRLTIAVDESEVNDRFRGFLRETLTSAPGDCPVFLRYRQDEQSALLRLGEQWQVSPSEDLLEELRREFGSERVALEFEIKAKEGERYESGRGY